jgi:hypothetical protein
MMRLGRGRCEGKAEMESRRGSPRKARGIGQQIESSRGKCVLWMSLDYAARLVKESAFT